MLIGIDGNEANVEKRVGVGVYAFELLKQFYTVKNVNFRIYLKKPPQADLPEERRGWNYRIVGPFSLWTQIGLPFDLYTHSPRPDVFFSPTHYAPRFSPIPTAVSIMDVSYLHYPELFAPADLYQLKHWTAYSVKQAKRVFTISESSKNDIIQAYTVESGRVIVTYPGVKTISNMDQLKKKFGVTEKYILFVGTLQPRKNIIRLIEAFSKIRIHPNGYSESTRIKNNSDLKLVIVGKKGWLFEDILSAPAKFGVEENVVFLHDVGEDELPSFYKHAECFVLPSLYEGFGLPVLEAMQHGCPVITSNVSSLPEAGGDAAVYVDPENVDDIAKKMSDVLENKSLRDSMVKKGYEQAKKFSWEKTASKTLEVLEEVARKQE